MKVKFKDWDCVIQSQHYRNNRIALSLVDATDGERIATATVNIPEMPLEDGEIFVKDYSENEGMLDALVAAGICQPTGKFVENGLVKIPVCKLLVDPMEL